MDDEEKRSSKIAFGDPTVPGVLPFDYLYAQLNSKPYRFTDLPKKARGQGTGLEELTVLRSMAVGKKVAADAAASDEPAEQQQQDEAERLFRESRDAGERVSWINKYLSALASFEGFLRSEGLSEPRPPTPKVPLPGGGVLSIVADAILSQDDVARKLSFEWQSALLGSGNGGYGKLSGIPAEKAATTALLAAALRNAGTAAAAAAASPGEGGDPGAALVNAASLFRRAAGLYDAIASAGSEASALPPLAELRPSAARALSCLCLADAQCLAALKAKGAGARGSAWAGAAQLYHQFGKELELDASAANAAAATSTASPEAASASAAVPPPVLSAAAAAAAALAAARARAAAAEAAFDGAAGGDSPSVPDPGVAMAHLREGVAALSAGRKAAERVDSDEQRRNKGKASSWVRAFDAEAAAFKAASERLDRERLTVYMTTVPSQAPAPPTARVVVSASAATVPAATPGLF